MRPMLEEISGVIDGYQRELWLYINHITDTYWWYRSDGHNFGPYQDLDAAFDFVNLPQEAR